MTGQVDAQPYPWPFDGPVDPGRTAVLCIDWQVDFCGRGGYVDTMGYDLSLTRAGLEPTARVLAAARAVGMTIIHTREGHRTGPLGPACQQALAVGPHWRRDRRRGALRANLGEGRAGLGDCAGGCAATG
ncbi:isochorismatase family protein [Mycobacteroides abscessus subsp. abscessus]